MGNSNNNENNIGKFSINDIMQGIPGGFFIYHADGNEELIYANDTMLHLFRCETKEEFQELTGNSFKGIVHPDDLERVEAHIAHQIAGDPQELDYVEYRIIRRDGEICWVEDFGHLVHDETEGDVFYVFISDITERIQKLDRERISHQEMINAASSRERQYMTAITSDAIAMYEVNLSKDLMEGKAIRFMGDEEISIAEDMGFSMPRRYSEFMRYLKKHVPVGSRQDYYDHCSPEYLLSCYEKGILDPCYDFWIQDGRGTWIYAHKIFVITKNEITGDIVAIALIKDHSEIREKQDQNLKQMEMIQALSVDYTSVYWVNLTLDTVQAFRMSNEIVKNFGNRFQEGSYIKLIQFYVTTSVYEPDREMLLAYATPEHLMEVLEKESSCAVNYRVMRDGKIEYYRMTASRIESVGEDVEIAIGFSNVDMEVRHEMEQRKLVEDAYEIISGLSSEYNFIGLIEPESGSLSIYKSTEESAEVMDTLAVQKNYYDAIHAYGKYVISDDKEMWFDVTRIENILARLQEKNIYNVNIRRISKDSKKTDYTQFTFTRVSDKGDAFQLVMAEKKITETIEKELMQRNLLRRYELLFVSATADIYSHLLRVDLETWETIQIDIRHGEFTKIDVGNWDDYLETKLMEVVPRDREKVRNTFNRSAFEQAKAGDKLTCSYESDAADNTGTIKYLSVTARVQGEKGQRFATVFSIDNTELVENERKQKALLEYALAQAQQANSAKTTFLSNMSHDMRTPMNAIIGFSAIAASHLDNVERVKDCLDKIMSSSSHLLSLINDILDMSRIESGKVQIQEQECNLSELLHTLANIIQPQVKAKQLDFFIDSIDVANEDIYADPLKLNQIFINILGNAVKFTDVGGSVSFRMRQKPCAAMGYGTYEFSIKDTGIGMSSEFMEHIFEPFERESSALKSGIEGTGLGMAITKKLVEIMGGTIKVSSEKGKGTEFVIILDLKLQENSDNSQDIRELEGLRALVVDDDVDACGSIAGMLGQIGMRSEWTTSGKEAVLSARKAFDELDPFHTYILDLDMPEQNGIETARNIRKAVGDDVPIVIVTGYDWSDVEKEAKEVGITAFCSKPLFMSDLKAALLKANHLMEESTASISFVDKDFSGKRVLVVEDNELNREIAEEILKEAGFTVEVAVDGSDAVSMVERSEEYYYDIILTDIQMPVMDGYEEVVAIRNMKRKDIATMPIIAMTANAFEEDKALALKCGMNGHIAKPLDISAVFKILNEHLK